MKPQRPPSHDFAACIGLDWANAKHDICLQATGSSRREQAVLEHRPERIDEWARNLRQRFKGKPIALALELDKGPIVDARLADGKAASTINRTLAVVHRILTLAARVWRDEHGLTWLESAPLLTRQQGPKRKGHILSLEEQQRFLAQLPEHLSEMALFGLHTGCRQGEIVGFRWEWVAERDGIRYVALPGSATKNGESRPIVLNRIAAAVVDACRGRHPTHVFTYQPRGKHARHPVERLRNSAWRRARSAAGLPGLQVHDLRRTFATRLREAGVSKWTVGACLGHKDGGVTELYALPTLRELRAAVETLEETGSSALAAIQLRHFSVSA